MTYLKGFFFGIAYWVAVLALIATGLEKGDERYLLAAAGMVLLFWIFWRRYWRGRRRRSSSSRRVPIPKSVRREVYARDGYTCVYCGRSGRSLRLTIDHVFPVAHGGTNDIRNLVTACRACNLTKGARVMNDAGLRRYADERRSWAGRNRRRGCLVRLGAIVVVGAVLAGLVWYFVL